MENHNYKALRPEDYQRRYNHVINPMHPETSIFKTMVDKLELAGTPLKTYGIANCNCPICKPEHHDKYAFRPSSCSFSRLRMHDYKLIHEFMQKHLARNSAATNTEQASGPIVLPQTEPIVVSPYFEQASEQQQTEATEVAQSSEQASGFSELQPTEAREDAHSSEQAGGVTELPPAQIIDLAQWELDQKYWEKLEHTNRVSKKSKATKKASARVSLPLPTLDDFLQLTDLMMED